MSQSDQHLILLFPMFIGPVASRRKGASGMPHENHRLRLTTVEPEDELAPIPFASAADRLLRPRMKVPDSIRMAEEALARVEHDFGRLKLVVNDGGPDRPRAA